MKWYTLTAIRAVTWAAIHQQFFFFLCETTLVKILFNFPELVSPTVLTPCSRHVLYFTQFTLLSVESTSASTLYIGKTSQSTKNHLASLYVFDGNAFSTFDASCAGFWSLQIFSNLSSFHEFSARIDWIFVVQIFCESERSVDTCLDESWQRNLSWTKRNLQNSDSDPK